MNRLKIIFTALFLSLLPPTQAHAQSDTLTTKDLKIVVTSLEENNELFELSYEIRNDSPQDVWILAGYGAHDTSVEVFMHEDGRTLIVRRCLDLPYHSTFGNLNGRYILLRTGQVCNQSIILSIPVNPKYEFDVGESRPWGIRRAKRLVIEIGYYPGDMLGMIHDILERMEKVVDNKINSPDDSLLSLNPYFKSLGLLYFNKMNETLRQRNEEILVPNTNQNLKGEQIVRTTIEGLRTPYEERYPLALFIRTKFPDIRFCTGVEIKYQPSVLEFFFPYRGQQILFNPEQIEYIQSIQTILVNDPEDIKTFVNDIKRIIPRYGYHGGVFSDIRKAHVVCHSKDGFHTSFSIYNDRCFVTDDESLQFIYPDEFQGLRRLTPHIRPFELRIQCAANMRNLWYQLRFYNKAEAKRLKNPSIKREIIYPTSTKWCDEKEQAYESVFMRYRNIVRPHICPSAGEGKNHYAMNPNCKPDSPPDTVLLFETKAGWNQNGGPELFTFDNHEPKGGCVLLNDGTVKFIRTKEELNKLRWK